VCVCVCVSVSIYCLLSFRLYVSFNLSYNFVSLNKFVFYILNVCFFDGLVS
jgi:hypothetical protein